MSNFDITKFLNELPRVLLTEITQYEDAKCPVCQVVYLEEDPDTGYAEHPVRLPGCNHIVGKHCILKWLKPKPDGCHANSCVICRHQFFEPWPAVVQRQYDANYQERDFDATEFASHLRAVEGAGYSIGHYFGFLSPRDRVVARQQMASNRRQVAVKEKELHFALGVRGARLLPPLHTDWEVLDHRQDQALFEYIEREGAFRGVSLNEAYRVESMGPLTGRV